MTSPLLQTWTCRRGAMVNAPNPVSELEIRKPPQTTGRSVPGRPSNGDRYPARSRGAMACTSGE